MLLQNIGDGLVNGSTDRVIDFYKSGQADHHHEGHKVGLLCHLKVDANCYPVDYYINSYAELAKISDLFPIVEFTANDGPEYILVLKKDSGQAFSGMFVCLALIIAKSSTDTIVPHLGSNHQ